LSENLNTKNLNIKILDRNNKEHTGGTAVNVGNPHIVFFVDDIEDYDLKKLGQQLKIINFFQKNVMLLLLRLSTTN
jgi:diaminopimelate epimerase